MLYDIHGDAWVYEDLGGNAYARRRVEVARHVGDRAVIAAASPRAPRSSPPAPPSCSAPSSGPGTACAGWSRSRCATGRRRRARRAARRRAARTLRTTPLDVFPEFAPPLVEVQTEAPGLSTNEVEALVTVPLEAALNGVPGLDTIRSKSVLGLSSVVLILDRRPT